MRTYTRKIWYTSVGGITLLALLLSLFGYGLSRAFHYTLPVILPVEEGITVIIDAGHGGEDSGAVGITGVYEKDINLAVARRVATLLRSNGITVIETRTEDVLLYDEDTQKGLHKVEDLKNRLAVCRANPEAVFVSIHMNSFPVEKYSGLQVYYSKNTPDGRILAEQIQNTVVTYLQKDNRRTVKEADDNIYLLDRAESTAVLVECGFLSNREECARLSEKDYQKELSFLLFCGIMSYISSGDGVEPSPPG